MLELLSIVRLFILYSYQHVSPEFDHLLSISVDLDICMGEKEPVQDSGWIKNEGLEFVIGEGIASSPCVSVALELALQKMYLGETWKIFVSHPLLGITETAAQELELAHSPNQIYVITLNSCFRVTLLCIWFYSRAVMLIPLTPDPCLFPRPRKAGSWNLLTSWPHPVATNKKDWNSSTKDNSTLPGQSLNSSRTISMPKDVSISV